MKIGDVIDLGNLTSVDRASTKVLGLADGSRVIGQVLDENADVLEVTEPFRIMVRPISDEELSLEILPFVFGGADRKINLKQSAVLYTYLPDEKVLGAYAQHASRRK